MGKKTKKRKPSGKKLGGPFLASAVLCEKIIAEENHVASLIRIVDRFTISPVGPLPKGFSAQMGITIFAHLSFKSGDFRGKKILRVKMQMESGEPMPEISIPLIFKGGTQGPSTHIEMGIPTKEGVHWLEVWLDKKLMTKIPLQVVIAKGEMTSAQERTRKKS